jgi:hypothetical protein
MEESQPKNEKNREYKRKNEMDRSMAMHDAYCWLHL